MHPIRLSKVDALSGTPNARTTSVTVQI